MSDILIRNMEMPKNCRICPCFQYDMFDDDIDGYCKALKTKIMNRSKHHPDCPLVEIPTPHGRLKDVDRIEYENVYFEDVGESYEIVGKDDIDELPTAIEAEGSEE